MSVSPSFFARIGKWFKRGGNGESELPLHGVIAENETDRTEGGRLSIFRPFARRDALLGSLAQSFQSLSELMNSIEANLEKQNQRQTELLGYLASLPEAIQSLPEQQRMQAETLKMISGQIEQQGAHQSRLAEVLEKIGDAHQSQKQILDSINERVDVLDENDHAIADNLKHVGSAMQSVSRSHENSSQVLQQMRQNINDRDTRLEDFLKRQNTRFTTMMAFAIFMSVAAVAAVCVIGYLLMTRTH